MEIKSTDLLRNHSQNKVPLTADFSFSARKCEIIFLLTTSVLWNLPRSQSSRTTENSLCFPTVDFGTRWTLFETKSISKHFGMKERLRGRRGVKQLLPI